MLSLIIPAYNESHRIRNTLLDYWKELKLYSEEKDIEFEIIVEMDGCTDGTQQIVKDLSKNIPELRYLEFKNRLGKGGGIKKGFEASKGEIIGFVDADGSVPATEFLKLLDTLKKGYDAVIASRRTAGAVVKNQPFRRKILSRCFNLYVRTLFGIPYNDTQCGAKVFKRQVLKAIFSELNVNGFTFDVNLLYLLYKRGYSVKEVGVVWQDKYGSKVCIPKAIYEMGLDVLKLRFYYSPLRSLFWRK